MSELVDLALVAFRAELERFRVTGDHWLPDVTLLGLLNDLEENAVTAAAIARSQLPHRSYPNVRAAFEAAHWR